MTLEEFHTLIDHPFDLTHEDTLSINKLAEQYPYFQTARVLSLRGMKQYDPEKYIELLKKTASYSTDRTLLFDYLTHQKILEENIQEELRKENTFDKIIEKTNKRETPFNLDEKQVLSFSEWLKISNQQNEPISEQKVEKFSTIDRFITLNPKLSPLQDRQKNINIALNSVTENKNIMTETLANIYIEQRKYDKAIQAFKILSLKNPEKSGYFTDQIRAIKKLDKK